MKNERVVAILGASANRSKFGNKSVRAYLRADWTVVPVNLKQGAIEGIEAVSKLNQIVEPIERVSVYLSPSVSAGMLPEIAAVGCNELWLNPGSYDDEVLQNAEQFGLNVVVGCSIVDIGFSPSDFPE